PERPVARPERFFAAERSMPVVGGGVALVCGAICAALGWSAARMARGEDGPKLVIALVMIAFFAWPAVWGARQVARYRAEGRAVAAGRARAGLYVEDDGILWRGWDGRVTWLPRSRIVAAKWGRPPDWGGGAAPEGGWLVYRDDAGAVATFSLSVRAVTSNLAGAIGAWLGGEPFRRPQY
ncbi:MAG: hypothetical protein R3F65_33975, partial [bacterium]